MLFVFVVANAEPKLTNVNYQSDSGQSQGVLEKKLAGQLVSQYYNNNGMWSRTYEIQVIRQLRIERIGNRRAIVHVEYTYKPVNPKSKHKSGVDKRDFTFVKHTGNLWTVISMGNHMSGMPSR